MAAIMIWLIFIPFTLAEDTQLMSKMIMPSFQSTSSPRTSKEKSLFHCASSCKMLDYDYDNLSGTEFGLECTLGNAIRSLVGGNDKKKDWNEEGPDPNEEDEEENKGPGPYEDNEEEIKGPGPNEKDIDEFNDLIANEKEKEEKKYFVDDCSNFKAKEGAFYHSGVRSLQLDGSTKALVYCDDDGWTRIQSRGQFGNPQDYFRRNWTEYENGFGEPGKEYWLGLKHIYYLTNNKTYNLKLFLESPVDGETLELLFSKFRLMDTTFYTLWYDTYLGEISKYKHGLRYHKHQKFSTYDVDNDGFDSSSCSERSGGTGWWFYKCLYSNLNGINYNSPDVHDRSGILFQPFMDNWYHSLRSAYMAIKPQ